MKFKKISGDDETSVTQLSQMATEILKDYYDDIIGVAQNDYMLKKFQTVPAIHNQINNGYEYFFAIKYDKKVGFFGFYKRENALYLSKLYLYKDERGKGYSKEILEFLKSQAEKMNLNRIELNVNKNNKTKYIYEKLGFRILRAEKIDIGNGFYMDDYVYYLEF